MCLARSFFFSFFQHTKECLAKIGIEAEGHDGEHGQDAIFRLIAAIMHLLNVGFKSGENSLNREVLA